MTPPPTRRPNNKAWSGEHVCPPTWNEIWGAVVIFLILLSIGWILNGIVHLLVLMRMPCP